MPNPTPRKAQADRPNHLMGGGRILYRPITPKKQKAYFPGTQIEMPDNTASGKAECKDIRHGRVTHCGLACARDSLEPFTQEAQDRLGFPLPAGMYIRVSQSNDHQVSPAENGCNTWDFIDGFMDRPDWVPDDFKE